MRTETYRRINPQNISTRENMAKLREEREFFIKHQKLFAEMRMAWHRLRGAKTQYLADDNTHPRRHCGEAWVEAEGVSAVALDKAIEHSKEKRKPYRGAKAIDYTCRNHGSCKWCEENRKHKFRDKKPIEPKEG